MPRTGVKISTCEGCEVGTCKSDPKRQGNGCKCHAGKRCKVWDQQGLCYTSYEEVPATARALWQAVDRKNQEEDSIASTASSVTCTPNSLK